MQELIDKLKLDWHLTLRNSPPVVDHEDPGYICLPKPFTAPSIENHFGYLYYWDTYFTNVGLILSDLLDIAIDNVENIAYLIEKIGYMPNANHARFLGRSQPPFFTLMVADIYEQTKDKSWLLRMYRIAESTAFGRERG